MESIWLASGTALWLGILTSISPCPLATNIVAVSYIARRVEKPGQVFVTGLLYTFGRMLAYVVVSMIVVWSLLSIPAISNTLQKYMNLALGPMLILVGLVMLGWLRLPNLTPRKQNRLAEKVESHGYWGAGMLGILFALSFCPVSAALFFGSLIPLAVQSHSSLLMPSIYGAGTALPVLAFALLIATGTKSLSQIFNWLSRAELWARKITAAVFVLIGVHLALIYWVGIDLSESLWRS